MRGRRKTGVAALLASILAGALVCAASARAAGPAHSAAKAPQDPADLQRETAALARELALATSESYYLVLEPAAGTLRLMLRGAPLWEMPVARVDVGRARALFRDRDPDDWARGSWEHGHLDPERERKIVEIVPPEPGASESAEVVVPAPPEEALPAPSAFRVVFDGRRVLEVVTGDGSASLPRRVADAFGALWRPEARLRVVLAPADAAALYRSLPDDSALIVR